MGDIHSYREQMGLYCWFPGGTAGAGRGRYIELKVLHGCFGDWREACGGSCIWRKVNIRVTTYEERSGAGRTMGSIRCKFLVSLEKLFATRMQVKVREQ